MSILREFLVSIGYRVDGASESTFRRSVNDSTKEVDKLAQAQDRLKQAEDAAAAALAPRAQARKKLTDEVRSARKRVREVEIEEKKAADTALKEDKNRAREEQKLIDDRVRRRARFLAWMAGGVVAAGGAALFGTGVAIRKSISNLDDLNFAAKRTGASVEGLRSLRYAFEQTGLSAADADSSIEALSKSLRTNPGSKAFVRNALGLDPDADPSKLLPKVAEALRERYRLYGTQVAGGETLGLDERVLNTFRTQDVGKYLKEAADMADQFGTDLKTASANAAAFSTEWRRLMESLGLLGDTAAGDASGGGLTGFLRWINDWLRQNGKWLSDELRKIGVAIREFLTKTVTAENWENFKRGLRETRDEIVKIKDAVIAISAALAALTAAKKLKDILALGGAPGASAAGGAAATARRVGLLGALGIYGAAAGGLYDLYERFSKAGTPEEDKSPGPHIGPDDLAVGIWGRMRRWFSGGGSAEAPKVTETKPLGRLGEGPLVRPPVIAGAPATELGRDTRNFFERLWDRLTGKSADPAIQASAFNANTPLSSTPGIRLPGRGGERGGSAAPPADGRNWWQRHAPKWLGGKEAGTGATSSGGSRFSSPSTAAKPGTYRPQYALGEADLSDTVVNKIAGEAIAGNVRSVDAVISNMLNRVGAKGWGPSGNLKEVATAPGQYAGYRRAGEKEANFIRARIRAIASGAVPDPTNGANTYRAAWYGVRGGSRWFNTIGKDGAVVGGNRFAFDPRVANGPYAPYKDSRSGTERLGRAVQGAVGALMPNGARSALVPGFDPEAMRQGFKVTPPGASSTDNSVRSVTNNLNVNTKANFGDGSSPLVNQFWRGQQRTAEDLLRTMSSAAQ